MSILKKFDENGEQCMIIIELVAPLNQFDGHKTRAL